MRNVGKRQRDMGRCDGTGSRLVGAGELLKEATALWLRAERRGAARQLGATCRPPFHRHTNFGQSPSLTGFLVL
ncbi:unnamed protein product [Arctia plantaginis]|uniref:Uncharacterized protein n=1 Tax=Arctia plantaginis TaxID=874455 RepID=A0A8S1BA83_ARCPL|nr:unnamed protein product [Arctia plantaginis]